MLQAQLTDDLQPAIRNELAVTAREIRTPLLLSLSVIARFLGQQQSRPQALDLIQISPELLQLSGACANSDLIYVTG